MSTLQEPRKRPSIRNIVLSGVLLILGIFLAATTVPPDSGGEVSLQKIGEFLGGALVMPLILYLCSIKIRFLKGWTTPLGIALAIPLIFASEQEPIIANINPRLMELRKNPQLLTVTQQHMTRVTEVIEVRYPSLSNPILDEPLPVNAQLSDVQALRDAYRDGMRAAQSLKMEYKDIFEQALNDDKAKFTESLVAISVPSDLIEHVIDLIDNELVTHSLPARENIYMLLARKMEVSQIIYDYLIREYGQWSQNQDGSFAFQDQHDVDQFNAMVSAEQQAVKTLQIAQQ